MQRFALLFLVLLSACASAPQTRQLLASPVDLPSQVELTQTPFFPQTKYQCGPAALATVLQHSGVNVDARSLVDEIYLPSRLGSLQIEILASTRRHGRLPYRIEPALSTLLKEVANGNPVLVLQNLGLSWAPQWHYAVVIGFDLHKQKIILRSGTDARRITDMHTFELTWARGQHWGIIATPPDKLPATASPDRFLRTALALENSHATKQRWNIVHTAYRTALSRWPNNLVALMGLGNSAYQLSDLTTAAQAFTTAVQAHPNTAAAHNNLAQALMDQGKLQEAGKHAQRAIEIGGPYLENFRETLKDIQQAQKPAGGLPVFTAPTDSSQRSATK